MTRKKNGDQSKGYSLLIQELMKRRNEGLQSIKRCPFGKPVLAKKT